MAKLLVFWLIKTEFGSLMQQSLDQWSKCLDHQSKSLDHWSNRVWISDPSVWISDPNVWIIDPTEFGSLIQMFGSLIQSLDQRSKCLDQWSKCLDQLLFTWCVCVLSGWSSKTLILRGQVLQQALWQAPYWGWGVGWIFHLDGGGYCHFFPCAVIASCVTSVVFFSFVIMKTHLFMFYVHTHMYIHMD